MRKTCNLIYLSHKKVGGHRENTKFSLFMLCLVKLPNSINIIPDANTSFLGI